MTHRSTRLALALVGLALLAAGPALAKSSLGIGTAEVTAAPSGPFAGLLLQIAVWQREFFTLLRQSLVALRNGEQASALALAGISFAYGVFHAAGPGHGKAVISSYVLANERALRRGVVLSFVSALVQAGTAIAVVALGWFVLRGTSVSMTQATDWLEIASYALIAAFGGWLLLRKVLAVARRRLAPLAAGGPGLATSALVFEAPMEGGGGRIMGRASAGLASGICSEDEACACGRAHMPDPAKLGGPQPLTLGAAASAVFAVGLRPCTGAIVVLTFALLNGLYVAGVLSVLAMALGTAITVSAIAALAVFAKGTALRLAGGGARRGLVLDALEILGAGLVLLLGLTLLGAALA